MRFGPVAIAEAEGCILAHSFALPAATLRKGARLTGADIAAMRDAGIETVIVAALEPDDVAEDDAATTLAAMMAGEGVSVRPASTGRVNLHADRAGVVVIDRQTVDAFNAVDPAITLATLPSHATVVSGQMVATVKIIPFAVPRGHVAEAASVLAGRVLRLHPFRPRRIGLIQTRLPSVKAGVLDKTARVTQTRLERSGSVVAEERRTAHDAADVARAIGEIEGDVVLVFGASAVCDADDVIPAAIRIAGGKVDRVGMPVDPGNLLVLGSLGATPVVGVPGCARSPKLNGFDWVLDRLLADVPIGSDDIAGMGVGGLLMEIPTRPRPREPKSAVRPRVGAILLAAGRASRMGGPNKLLARFDGVALVRRAAEEIARAPVASVIAVTGHQADAVGRTLDGLDVVIVHNPDFATGLASSLRTGLAALPEDCAGALVCLADMPSLRADHIGLLVEAFVEAGGRSVVRASCGAEPGNPVILPRSLFAAAASLQGDRGARRLIEEAGLDIVDVDIGAAALADVDTPQALAEAGGIVTG